MSALLSSVSRFSTQASTPVNKNAVKLFENKLATPLLAARECRIAPAAIVCTPQTIDVSLSANRFFSHLQNNLNIRNISLSAPKQSAAGGDHSGLWTAERGLSLGLLAVLPAALAFPSQPLDTILSISLVMHAHWGLEAIVTDYVRPVLFGNTVPKIAHGLLWLYSALVLGGLLYFTYTDVGPSRAVRSLWAVKGQ